ncbi:MAG: response regulator [Labilithrix sp.]|nr:response regulator [Labilithrix sp.]MCW5811280.1 response regulator [Labilithrix sp.]
MTVVLVVDDSPIDRRLAAGLLTRAGYETRLAENGELALKSLEKERADLILTDLQMPGMDGLTLVDAICSQYTDIPIILMTAHGSEDLAVRALQRGAASYVPKRDLGRSLVETVASVLSLTDVLDAAPPSVRQPAMHWELPSDLAEITPVIAVLEGRLQRLGLSDETALLQISVALREAIVNAMLHGNLEVSSAEKETDPAAHDRLVEERRKISPYRERKVRVTATEVPGEVTYVVSDEGPGFDVASLPDPMDPANLERASGRGLFLIRTFMDDVEHSDGGRTLTMVKRVAAG